MLDPKTGINFPFYQSQVQELFGTPNYNQFAKDYLRNCDLSEYADALSHVVDFEGNPWGYKIYCNWIMVDPLKKAFGLIVGRGLAKYIKTYDGCFNIRQSKGGGIMSMHSYALAVDFNAGSNGYGSKPAMNHEVVKCFAECGFEWGGLWGTPDGMHFQLVWVRDRDDGNPLNPIPWKAGGEDVQLPETDDTGAVDKQAVGGEILLAMGGDGDGAGDADTGLPEAPTPGDNLEDTGRDAGSTGDSAGDGVLQTIERGVLSWFKRKG